jgi:hypothetical protein
VIPRPSADYFVVGRRQKEAATETIEFPITSDYADGHQYSSDQSIKENENYSPSFTGLGTWG